MSISLTEEAHPKSEKKIANIVHTAGDQEVKIPQSEKPNFVLEIQEAAKTASWDQVMEKTVENFNKNAHDCLAVATCNSCVDDAKISMVFSYDFNESEALKEKMRPTGCCTLF